MTYSAHIVRHCIDLWTKEGHPTDEDIKSAAEELYSILFHAALANGDEWASKPKFVCKLGEFVSIPHELRFWDLLRKAFKEKTGLDWDANKYVLVYIPLDIIGGRTFVVFDKQKV